MTVAVAAAALLPALVVKAPLGIVLVAAPAVLEVTLTITVQPGVAGMLLPLAMVKLPAPAVAVTPVQVPVLPAVPMVMPVGKVSVNRLLSVIAAALLLPMVTVRLVLPPLARLATAKALVIVGAADTVKVALAVPPVKATGPVAVTAVVVLSAAPTVLEVTLACN